MADHCKNIGTASSTRSTDTLTTSWIFLEVNGVNKNPHLVGPAGFEPATKGL